MIDHHVQFEVREDPSSDRPKVTGEARYAADITRPGALWAKILLSPLPHARLRSIDASTARGMPGVRAILTGADLRGHRLGRQLQDWPVLADEVVRFVGDRVAAVAADTPEAASDALDAIDVEYEELPIVGDPTEALADLAPVLHPNRDAYTYFPGVIPPVPHPNVQGYQLVERGGPLVDEAFARASHVFEHEFTTPRHHHGYIEPHACLVWISYDGVVHVVSSNKAPFLLRQQLSGATGLPADSFEVDNANVGGDFGGKGMAVDEVVCFFLARQAGRPVRSITSYVDELAASSPRHAARVRLRTATDERGNFLAHEADITFDGGAYAAAKPIAALIPGVGRLDGGLYSLPAYRVPCARLRLRSVYTNNVPGGHMRSPGELQIQFASESHVDEIAQALDIDPIELRRRNSLRSGEANVGGDLVREARGPEVLSALEPDISAYRTRPSTTPRYARGVGVALSCREIHGGRAEITLRGLPTGSIELVTGLPDQGGRQHEMLRRVTAAALGLDTNRVAVVRRSTSEAPFDLGVAASRVTWIVGGAAVAAADSLCQQIKAAAAEQLHVDSGALRIGEGFVWSGEQRLSSIEGILSSAEQTPLVATASFQAGSAGGAAGADFNFVAFAAFVEVDRDSGQVFVRDVAMALDVGMIINPVAHAGQLDGGFVQGLGAALMEHLVVQEGRVLSTSLAEYKIPTSADIPRFHPIIVPGGTGPGPFGSKMVGEANVSGVAPAIANAIADAVGVRLFSLPLSGEPLARAIAASLEGPPETHSPQ